MNIPPWPLSESGKWSLNSTGQQFHSRTHSLHLESHKKVRGRVTPARYEWKYKSEETVFWLHLKSKSNMMSMKEIEDDRCRDGIRKENFICLRKSFTRGNKHQSLNGNNLDQLKFVAHISGCFKIYESFFVFVFVRRYIFFQSQRVVRWSGLYSWLFDTNRLIFI